MLNKLLPKTPLGMIVTAATVILAVSPEARKFTRRVAVKGIASVLSAVDQLKAMTNIESNHTEDGKEGMNQSAHGYTGATTAFYDTDIVPEPFSEKRELPTSVFNVLDDNYLKKQYLEHEKH